MKKRFYYLVQNWALLWIFGLLIIAFNADKIAGTTPRLCITHTNFCILPLSPFEPNHMDKAVIKPIPPLSSEAIYSKHYLGTDRLGRDVLSMLIHGTNRTLTVAFWSTLLSFIIGSTLGIVAGLVGSRRFKISILSAIIILSLLFLNVWYWIYLPDTTYSTTLFIGLSLLSLVVLTSIYFFEKYTPTSFKINLPLDTLLIKCIEIRKSIPGLFVVLVIIAIIDRPTIIHMIATIVLLGWVDFTRISRIETLHVSTLPFYINARFSGIPYHIIVWHHVWPHIRTSLFISATFMMGTAVLLESSLAFLGLDGSNTMSWGRIMADGRTSHLWWMVVWPGLLIFTLLYSLFALRNDLRNRRGEEPNQIMPR